MNGLELMLRELRLGTVVRHAQEVAIHAEREGWSFTRYSRMIWSRWNCSNAGSVGLKNGSRSRVYLRARP